MVKALPCDGGVAGSNPTGSFLMFVTLHTQHSLSNCHNPILSYSVIKIDAS